MKYIDLSTSIFRERQYVSLFSMEIITLDVSSVYSLYMFSMGIWNNWKKCMFSNSQIL